MKKLIRIIVTMSLPFSLIGCSNKTKELESKVEELEQENEELQEQVDYYDQAYTDWSTAQNYTWNLVESVLTDYTPIDLNSDYTVGDVMSIHLDSYEWCDEVVPSNTSGKYEGYDDEEDYKYLVVHGSLTNMSDTTFDPYNCSYAVIVIDDGYQFVAYLDVEEADGDGYNAKVLPGETLPLIILGSVPDEIYDVSEKVEMAIYIVNEEEHLLDYYNSENAHDSLKLTLQ